MCGEFCRLLEAALIHHCDNLAQRGGGCFTKWTRRQHPERDRDRERLVDCEPQWCERVRRIDAVPAGPARLSPNGHASLLQCRQVALDGSRTHAEPSGEPPGAPRPRSHSAKLLDKRVQPVGAIHTSTLVLGLQQEPPCSPGLPEPVLSPTRSRERLK